MKSKDRISGLLGGLSFLWLMNFLSSAALAQPSIITVIQDSLGAIVSVESEVSRFYSKPQSSAAIIPQKNKFLIWRRLIGTSYLRSGAGIIIDTDGTIVTNAHNIINAQDITIVLNNKKRIPAHTVWVAPGNDLAFLSIVPFNGIQNMGFADSSRVKLGDEVFTVGHSASLKDTISGGKIVGLGTKAKALKNTNQETALFQVNINMYKGDSGGPLLNRNGDLVGLIVAGQVKKDRSSFAIPSNEIKRQYESFRKRQTASPSGEK